MTITQKYNAKLDSIQRDVEFMLDEMPPDAKVARKEQLDAATIAQRRLRAAMTALNINWRKER